VVFKANHLTENSKHYTHSVNSNSVHLIFTQYTHKNSWINTKQTRQQSYFGSVISDEYQLGNRWAYATAPEPPRGINITKYITLTWVTTLCPRNKKC